MSPAIVAFNPILSDEDEIFLEYLNSLTPQEARVVSDEFYLYVATLNQRLGQLIAYAESAESAESKEDAQPTQPTQPKHKAQTTTTQ